MGMVKYSSASLCHSKMFTAGLDHSVTCIYIYSHSCDQILSNIRKGDG